MIDLNKIPEDRRATYLAFASEFAGIFKIDLDSYEVNNLPTKSVLEVKFLSYNLVIFLFNDRWSLVVFEPPQELSLFSITSEDFEFLRHYLHMTELMLTTRYAKTHKSKDSVYEAEDI